MSFNINGPSNKPIIQEAQTMQNNGGGGNLGYFQTERKEKEFTPEEMVDMFEKGDTFENEAEENLPPGLLERIWNFIKKLFEKIFSKKPQKKQSEGDGFLTLSKK